MINTEKPEWLKPALDEKEGRADVNYDKYKGGDQRIDNDSRAKLCKTCRNAPVLRRHRVSGVHMLQCTVCKQRTLDYADPVTAVDAWNAKN